MLRRKGEVYQTVVRVLHPQIPSHSLKHPSNTTNIPFAQNWQACPSRSMAISRERSKELFWANADSIESSRTHFSLNHNSCHQKRRHRFHQRHLASQKTISSCYSTQTYISRFQHCNLKSLHAKRQTYTSAYDPELAACMDRWIKVVFPGQRKMYSSLVKPLYSPTTTAYNVVDVPNNASASDPLVESKPPQPHSAQKEQKLEGSIITSVVSQEASTLTIISSEFISNFRMSMDEIPFENYQLPKEFRPLGVNKTIGANKRKLDVMLAKDQRKRIDDLWNMYISIPTSYKEQLTRRDYGKLMRMMCYSRDPMEGATRVVKIQCDLHHGISPTQRMLEMVAQANIVLGSISESIKFYNKSASIPKHGTLYHKRLLWSMIDAFAANNYASQGIAFLDELPPFFPENEDPKLYMHNLYRRLFLYRFESKERFQPTGNSMAARISLIKSIIEKPYVPSLEHVSRALRRIRRYEEGNQLSKEVGDAIEIFSKVASGMIIKCSDEASETVAAMMQDLILYSQFGEATRVLDLTLHNSVESVMDRIRYRLIEIEMRDEKDRSSDILEKWEAIVALHTKTVTEESVKNDLSATEERWSKYLDTEYSRLVQKSITEFDVPMATVVAKYMSRKGRIARGIDFYYLNSFMVNQCNSLDYMPYLEIRYAVGDPPDLHTYRRLIYASCRRSDISGALTLLKKAKALHPHWVIDTRTYNAIISSASAMGNPYLAKTTFMRLLQDGLKPDIKSYHGLLNGYSLTGNLKEAIKTSELMIKRRLTPTTTTFNLIMKAYLKHSLDMGTSLKIFTVMQESGIKGVPPDIVTFNQLLEGYRKVGNSMWFDAYFDNYFGSTSNKPVRNGETVTAWSAKVPEIRQGQNLIRPEKPSDWTLFIQLRHSLSLTDISLSTVQELWQALKPRLCDLDQNLDGSKPLPSSYPGTNLIKDSEDDLPPTFVPFKKKFGHITMPGTDRAHFRFIILNLFRHAFLIRGDLTGVKTVDGALAMHFPNHPAGSSVRKEKIIKKARQFMEKKIIK